MLSLADLLLTVFWVSQSLFLLILGLAILDHLILGLANFLELISGLAKLLFSCCWA